VRARRRTLARGGFSLQGGSGKTVRLPLTRAGRRLLAARRHGGHRRALRTQVRLLDAAGVVVSLKRPLR
jgi:hypothetical protein